MSADYLLLYYPDRVVTYSGSSLSSCQRFEVHDGGTVISVNWFRAGHKSGGQRWDFDLLEIRTDLRVVRGGSREDGGDDDGVSVLVDSVSMDGRKRRGDFDDEVDADKDPFGFDLLPRGSDGFVSALLHRPGAVNCADQFTNLLRDLTSERTMERRREEGERRGLPGYFPPPLPPLTMWPLLPRTVW